MSLVDTTCLPGLAPEDQGENIFEAILGIQGGTTVDIRITEDDLERITEDSNTRILE